jgi:hypothetical protein
VIGCLCIGAPVRDGHDADIRSWTRADRAHLDKPLHDAVSRWLSDAWPFRHPDYAAR